MKNLGCLVVGMAICLSGCGGGGGGGAATLSSLLISIPTNSNIATGVQLPISVLAVYSNGTKTKVIADSWGTTGGVGTITTDGIFTAAGSAATGTIMANYQGVPGAVTVTITTTGGLGSFRVVPPQGLDTAKLTFASKANFYMVAKDAGNNDVYVSADSWSASPSGIGSLSAIGEFTPASDGSGQINATKNSLPAVPADVTIVADKVSVNGKVVNQLDGTGISGATIVFLNAVGQTVGQATTKSDGSWTASVSTTAASLYVSSVPVGWHAEFAFLGKVYHTNDPDLCHAPIAAPQQNLAYPNILLYDTNSPPPPPDC